MRIAVIGNVAIHHLEFVMLVLPADRAHFKSLKREFRVSYPQLTSSHADEILAAGAGFRTYATMKAGDGRPWAFRTEPLVKRWEALGGEGLKPWKGWNDFSKYHGSGLGLHPSQQDMIDALPPIGGVFVGGLTGSGKSTLMRWMVMEKNRKASFKSKIYTVEDPPEYPMPGVTQVAVRHDENTEDPFRIPLLAAMKGDPDIIMIGEIRDRFTAKGGKRAIQSGHQVFTSIHAPSALGIVERLSDFEIGNQALGSSEFFSLLVYQKLLPVLCPGCSQPLNLKADNALLQRVKRVMNGRGLDPVRVQGDGCSLCRGTPNGLAGRTACADFLVPSLNMLRHIRAGDLLGAYRARDLIHPPLDGPDLGSSALDHALWKMARGMISPQHIEEAFGPLDGERQGSSD